MQTAPPGAEWPSRSNADANREDLLPTPRQQPVFSRVATEYLVDAFDCDPTRLSDLSCLREICADVVRELKLRVIGQPHWHQFPRPATLPEESKVAGGVTGLYLLAESHLTCHTFPEHGSAVFNLYCCRRRREWDWAAFLEQRLGAAHVVVRSVVRGASNGDPTTAERIPQ